jgi:hypothetical protein
MNILPHSLKVPPVPYTGGSYFVQFRFNVTKIYTTF